MNKNFSFECCGSHQLVSVCVVTYNHENYIEQCIESILSQDVNFDFEVIVANDASTDRTLEKLMQLKYKYPQRLRIISHEVNVGPYKNYRHIHQQANGIYIAHCDGDDYWLPGKLQQQVDFLMKNTDCVAVYTNADVIDENGQYIARFNGRNILQKFDLNYLVAKSNFLCHSSLVYRAELRDKVFPTLDAFVDYHVHINLAKFGLLAYINMQGVVYRYNSGESLVKTSGDKVRELINVAVLSAKDDITVSALRSFDVYVTSRRILNALRNRDFSLVKFVCSPISGESRTKIFLYGFFDFLYFSFIKFISKVGGCSRSSNVMFPRF